MSKLLQERWQRLTFGVKSINESGNIIDRKHAKASLEQLKKFNGHHPIYTGISTHFHKESGEHNDGYNQIENLDYTGWDFLFGTFKQSASLS